MAGTLVRVTTFVPSTPILSSEANAELNQLVNLLNGTTSNVKAVFKVSDAGDPPIEANQLSTGPIQKWLQGGILKAQMNNDGSMSVTQALAITGAGFPGLTITNTSAVEVLEFFVGDAGTIFCNAGGGSNLWQADSDTFVVSFSQIPTGPASNPTTANQLARKQYTDDQRVRWSVSWSYVQLPGAVETTESVPRWIVPDGQDVTIEDITVVWAAGSDSGASNVFTIKRRNSSGTLQSDVGTIDVNTPAQSALQINNIADLPLTAGDQIYPLFTTRNTASEQMVTISIRGYQKSKTT